MLINFGTDCLCICRNHKPICRVVIIESINGESLTLKYKISRGKIIARGTVAAICLRIPLFSNKTSFYSAFRVRSIKFLYSHENICYQRIRNLILAPNYDIQISVAAGVNEKYITRRKIKRLSIHFSRNHSNAHKHVVVNLSFLWTITNSHFTYFGTSSVETEQRILIFENFSSFLAATFVLSIPRD